MADDTLRYAPHFPTPELIERGRANTITCPVYRGTGLVVPASGTVTVYDADELAVVDGAVVGFGVDSATYTIPAASIAGKVFGDGWRAVWSLVMPDRAEPYTFVNDASLVKHRLYAVITQIDLTKRYSDLERNRPRNRASYQDYIDEAWIDIENRLIAEGRRPWLVMSPSAFRACHLERSAELIFNDFSTAAGADSKWGAEAKLRGQAYEREWGKLTFKYDEVGDGSGGKEGRTGARSVTWMGTHGYRGGV